MRPEGANHQWRKSPSRELSIDLVADERLGRVTGWAGRTHSIRRVVARHVGKVVRVIGGARPLNSLMRIELIIGMKFNPEATIDTNLRLFTIGQNTWTGLVQRPEAPCAGCDGARKNYR